MKSRAVKSVVLNGTYVDLHYFVPFTGIVGNVPTDDEILTSLTYTDSFVYITDAKKRLEKMAKEFASLHPDAVLTGDIVNGFLFQFANDSQQNRWFEIYKIHVH